MVAFAHIKVAVLAATACIQLFAPAMACPGAASRSQNNQNTRNLLQVTARIAYGAEIPKGYKFKFTALITIKRKGRVMGSCTGSVIAPKWVLTAAHCGFVWGKAMGAKKFEVRIGSFNRTKGEIYNVTQKITHGYKAGSHVNDIMLLRLDRPALATPVAIAHPNFKLTDGQKATTMGWGGQENGAATIKLRYTEMPYISRAKCLAPHKKLFGNGIPGDHLCFGLSTVTRSNTCGGDSGGPYFILKGGIPVLVGVTSYGNSVCGSKNNNLDVPTSVMPHAKWIKKITENQALLLKGGI